MKFLSAKFYIPFLSLAFITFLLVSAGTLTPTVSNTSSPPLYSLSERNNFILNTTPATENTGFVSTTSNPNTTTFVSLEEVYANLGNLIQRERIKTGVNYLGITGNFAMPDAERVVFSTTSTSLTPGSSPDSTGYSLEDLRRLLDRNINETTTAGSHSFSTSSAVGTSMYSLSDVYEALISLIQPTDVAIGTTYLGVTGPYFPEIPNLVAHYKMNDSAVTGGTESEAGSLGTGLVAHFPMNDNAGNTTVDNTIQAVDTTHVAGLLGGAINFSGTNYIDAGSNAVLNSDTFTISTWVKGSNGIDGYWQTILSKGIWNTGEGWLLYQDGDYLTFGKVLSESSVSVLNPFDDEQWHHVVIQSDSTTLKMYFDNVLQTPTTGSIVQNASIPLYIGTRRSNDGSSVEDNYFRGIIDETGYWNRILTAGEVASLYNSGSGIQGDILVAPFDDGFVAGYHLDESSGLAVDFSGNGNMGTLYGLSNNNGTATKETLFMSTAGMVNGALIFDGVSDYVDTGLKGISGSNPRTITSWFKMDDGTHVQTIWGYGVDTMLSSFQLLYNGYEDPGNLMLHFTNYTLNTTGLSLNDGNWHIAVVTYDGTTAKLYVDGNLENSGDFALNTSDANNFQIGSSIAPGWNVKFKGKIDDVRIYDRALSQSEVESLMTSGTRVTDSSGNGNNGTAILDTQTISTAGKVNDALSFNGSSDRVSLPDYDFSDKDITVSSWIKLASSDAAWNAIVSERASGEDYSFLFITLGSSNNITFFSSDLNPVQFDSTLTRNIGEWHHVSMVLDNTVKTITFYIDGVADTPISFEGSIFDDSANTAIGSDWSGGWSNYLNGEMDDVRIYNRALTEQEIKSLYFFGDGTEEEGGPLAE